MSTASRNKNLVFIIAVLLLTNIAVLAYFLVFKKSEPHNEHQGDRRNGMMVEMLEKEVGFDSKQMTQYKQLKDLQKITVRPLFDEMRKAKDNLFRYLPDPNVNDSAISSAADVIGQKQKTLDLQTFSHFKQVRNLCSSPEQQIKFDSAVNRMFRKMGRPANKNGSDKEVKSDK